MPASPSGGLTAAATRRTAAGTRMQWSSGRPARSSLYQSPRRSLKKTSVPSSRSLGGSEAEGLGDWDTGSASGQQLYVDPRFVVNPRSSGTRTHLECQSHQSAFSFRAGRMLVKAVNAVQIKHMTPLIARRKPEVGSPVQARPTFFRESYCASTTSRQARQFSAVALKLRSYTIRLRTKT